jgi:hypothetical protein
VASLSARLAATPHLRRDVEAATRLGVSLRRWYGWEPVTVSTVTADGVTRTTREAEWDDDDRAWVLALLDVESQRCPGCGGHLPDTTRPEHDGAYDAGPPVRCFRCTALHARQEQYRDDPHHAAQVLWPVHLTPMMGGEQGG